MRSENFLTRWHLLLTVFLGAFAYALTYLPRFPFDPRLRWVCIASVAMHLVLYTAFPRLKTLHWNLANLFNTVLLGFALHYTGGITSPFLVFLPLIFIAGAGHRINYPLALGAAIAAFLAVICAERYGALEPLALSPSSVYASGPVTLLVALTVVGHMLVAGSIYRVTVNRLREMLESEHAQKTAAIKRLGQLDAPSQLGLLAAKIAHDLRGPLGAIQGFLQLTREQEELSSECREDCVLIVGEIDRLTRMIDRMVQYGKPSESALELLDPREAIENVVSIIRHHPKARRVDFRTFFDGGDLRVKANREHLQQVYFNILKNSMEALAGRDSGSASVRLSRDGSSALIVFEDDGPGIPPDLLERLSDESISTKKDGSGLGLLIAREVLREHGGSISIGNRAGGGASVALRLPLEAA